MKGRFLLIFSFHLDSTIALVGIEEALELESFQGFKLLIYLREGVMILWEIIVQIRLVNAHPP